MNKHWTKKWRGNQKPMHNQFRALNSSKFEFKIRGKNPKDDEAKSYIENHQEQFWYAWAIAKHESRQGNQIYNQFNSGGDGPGNLELPNWGDPNGWGVFQRDDTDEGIYVDTKQVYSWQENNTVAIKELTDKKKGVDQYLNQIQQQYTNQFVEPPLFDVSAQMGVTGFPVAANYNDGHTVTGRDGLTITLYNGGYYVWLKFIPNEPDPQKRWQFKPKNAPKANEPYVTKIMEEYRKN
ncbi:MAG: hypothetical protein K1X66_00695 [Verrucomicrobiae bacterium]|nr:hypothetical protein [Verrucomicrobiae bacterium]